MTRLISSRKASKRSRPEADSSAGMTVVARVSLPRSPARLDLFGVPRAILAPQTRNLHPVLHKLAAHVETPRDLRRSLAREHEATQRRVWHERRRAHSVSRLLVRLVVIARHSLPLLVLRDD